VSGSSSAVERQLPKLDVAGSIPVSRSKMFLNNLEPTFTVTSADPTEIYSRFTILYVKLAVDVFEYDDGLSRLQSKI
jgi:hypothetical protein